MATEAPLEKSRTEWTDANRILFFRGLFDGTQTGSVLESVDGAVIGVDPGPRVTTIQYHDPWN